jgi:RNA-directed DNA polymerase
VIAVRYADDSVLGFQKKKTAERFLSEMRERLAKFGLSLHPDKTRLIEFGRFAEKIIAHEGREGRRPSTSWASRTVAAMTDKGSFK